MGLVFTASAPLLAAEKKVALLAGVYQYQKCIFQNLDDLERDVTELDKLGSRTVPLLNGADDDL